MATRKWVLVLIVLVTLAVAGLVATDVLSVLRGPAPQTAEWYWPYQPRPLLRWIPAVLVAAGLLLLVYRWLQRPADSRRANGLALAALVCGHLLLQLALIYGDRPDVAAELVDRTLSVQTSGYFWTAAHIENLWQVLSDYPAHMPLFESEHARTHPPGLVVGNWLAISAMERTPGAATALAREVWPLRCTDLWLLDRPAAIPAALLIWAVLPLVAGALAVLPAYGLSRRLFGADEARIATAGVACIPGLLIFTPQSDQLFVPLSLLTVWALDVALERRRWFLFLLPGFLLSLSSFLTLGNAALLLAMAVYAALWWWRQAERPRPGTLLAWGSALALGLASVWLLYWAGWGVSPFAVLQTGLSQHYELVTHLRRYEWWLVYNLVDLLTFLGVPLLAGFIVLLPGAGRGRWGKIGRLALALLVLLLVLNLSGSTRGETGRLWLFFTPIIGLLGGGFLAQLYGRRWERLLLLGLQLLLVLVVGLAWRPHRAVIVVAQEPEMATRPATLTPLNIAFNDQIMLAGYTLHGVDEARPDALQLTLVWQATGRNVRPYTVFNHVVDPQGEVVAQQDGWPVDGQWPPTCWRAGDEIVDVYQIALPADLPAGDYHLVTGLYDARTEERLTPAGGSDSVLLHTITIAP